MTDRELMQHMLEVLNRNDYPGWQLNIPIVIALRERLTQPLYAAPPQRTWVDLTDEEIEACRQQGYDHSGLSASFDFVKAARAIESKLKEKNT